MTRRILVALYSLWWLSAGCSHAAPAAAPAQENVRALHDALLVLDSHIDIPFNFATAQADPAQDGPMQVDLPKMRAGGLDAGFFIIYVGQGPLTEAGYAQAYRAALTKFEAIARMTEVHADEIGLARTAAQAQALHAAGKKIAMIGIENGYPVGANGEHLQEFYRRGARYMSLTHFGHNQLATSSGTSAIDQDGAAPPCDGICPLGLRVIGAMNRLGMLVDVSHTSRQTTLQAVAASQAPVIASHSALRAFNDIPRNIGDDEVRAIAARGGVVQIVAFDSYLKPVADAKAAQIKIIRARLGFVNAASFDTASEQQKLQLRTEVNALDAQWPRADVGLLVDQIDYAVRLVGIDHVGIASDFGGSGGIKGWDDASQTFAVTQELWRRGYRRDAIAKLWGLNLLRVWGEAERIAAGLQQQ
jgi:membrane dipeptidase